MNKYVCVLTYDYSHRKTQDLLFQLKTKGIKDLIVIAVPWVERKKYKSLLPHRPHNCIDIPLKDFCHELNFGYKTFQNYDEILMYFTDIIPRYILIGGAGILPEKLVKRWKIFNAHPGWLPNVRGLDALKWAIWHEEKIGVTTHVCGVEADTGLLIKREEVPFYLSDTFYSVAQRQYEMEIEMLANSMNDFVNVKGAFVKLDKLYADIVPTNSPLHRRMPSEKERYLEELLKRRILKNVNIMD